MLYQSLYFVLSLCFLSLVFPFDTPVYGQETPQSQAGNGQKKKKKKSAVKATERQRTDKAQKAGSQVNQSSQASLLTQDRSKAIPSLQSLFSNIQGKTTEEVLNPQQPAERFQVKSNSDIYFADDTQIELLLLGSFNQLTSAFGHVALKVSIKSAWGDADQHWVYDLGFHAKAVSPMDFLFDHPIFEIKKFRYQELLKYWQMQDRDILAIPLQLPQYLSGKLYLDLEKLVDSRYAYHPFENNCATQVRDLLDRHLNGHLYQTVTTQAFEKKASKNDLRKKLSQSYFYAFIFELFGGIKLEESQNLWQQAYHGEGLWKLLSVVELNQKALIGDAKVLYERQAVTTGSTLSIGMLLCFILGTILLLLQWVLSSKTALAILEFSSILLLAVLSMSALYVAWYSSLLELRQPIALLLFLPTDLLAILLWFLEDDQEESLRKTYFRLRLYFLGVTAILVLLVLGWHALQLPVFFFAFCCLWTAKHQLKMQFL